MQAGAKANVGLVTRARIIGGAIYVLRERGVVSTTLDDI